MLNGGIERFIVVVKETLPHGIRMNNVVFSELFGANRNQQGNLSGARRL